MQKKLKGKKGAFAAVITSGNELDHLDLPSEPVRNLLKYATLNAAREAIDTLLKEKFGFQKIGKLNPGSLPDWPIVNNVGLFKIIGNVTESIGVQMTDEFYMQPSYTVSELLFSSDEDYSNCSLCEKYDCIGRQVSFDAEAYDKIFR